MDWTLYWFMFPVAMTVATCAMMSGIGGAALFMPIYVLIFPLLGSQYPFETTVLAVIVSLITMSFSFASGVSVYAARRQIDYKLAFRFLLISVPLAFIASMMAPFLDDRVLLTLYSILITGVAISIYRAKPAPVPTQQPKPRSPVFGAIMTAIGGFTTGAASVGIGEVVMPQLMARRLKSSIAAGTSVFVVFITVVASSLILSLQLIKQGDVDIPWNVICYTVPGVLIGAQIGPRLQGKIPQRKFELAIATLFIGIAIATMFVVLKRFA